jgi:hypothetical protein
VTIGAVWVNEERVGDPALWMATDSRISDQGGTLIDEGIKLFELPVICRKPDAAGWFTEAFYSTSIGMVCAGGSLVYQHVHGTLVPILSNLIGGGSSVPTVEAFAALTAAVVTKYVRSLGQRRRDAHRVALVIGGKTPGYPHDAFILEPDLGRDELIAFRPRRLDLRDGAVHFVGEHVDEARVLIDDLRRESEPGAATDRAALSVIRRFIDDPNKPSIGGGVQIGFTVGTSFRRVASVVPRTGEAPKTMSLLNGIDLDDLPNVGPCRIGITGMVSP